MFCFLWTFQGLQVGDEVIEFGSVTTGNFQNLQNIASVVQHSEGVRLKFKCNLNFYFIIYQQIIKSCFIFTYLFYYGFF